MSLNSASKPMGRSLLSSSPMYASPKLSFGFQYISHTMETHPPPSDRFANSGRTALETGRDVGKRSDPRRALAGEAAVLDDAIVVGRVIDELLKGQAHGCGGARLAPSGDLDRGVLGGGMARNRNRHRYSLSLLVNAAGPARAWRASPEERTGRVRYQVAGAAVTVGTPSRAAMLGRVGSRQTPPQSAIPSSSNCGSKSPLSSSARNAL